MAKITPTQLEALASKRLDLWDDGSWRNGDGKKFGEATVRALFGFGLVSGENRDYRHCRTLTATDAGLAALTDAERP